MAARHIVELEFERPNDFRQFARLAAEYPEKYGTRTPLGGGWKLPRGKRRLADLLTALRAYGGHIVDDVSTEGTMMGDDWVTDVLGSEGIIGHDYELPPMAERIGGPYELPEIGGCPPPRSVAMAGAPLYVRHGDVEFWHQRPRAARKLRTNLEAISGAMYDLECAGYEAAAAALDAYAGAMLDGWPAGSEYIETGFSFGSLVSSISHAVSSVARTVVQNNPVAKIVQKAIAPITRTVTNAAQTLVNGVRKYNPVALAKIAFIKAKALAGDIKNSVIFKTLQAIASKALAPALAVIRMAGPVLPYVQSVISFVPGVGTGVSAALGAAQALADGRPIDEAIVAAAKGAIPGGPMAQMAFDAAWGLAHGRPIEAAALDALRQRLPHGLAQRAFDTGVALATAKTAQDRRNALKTAALGALASNLPTVPGFPAIPGAARPMVSALSRLPGLA
jgi:hypothetical protein